MSNIRMFPNTSDPVLDRFGDELDKLIEEVSGKQITYASIVGTLEAKKARLIDEWLDTSK